MLIVHYFKSLAALAVLILLVNVPILSGNIAYADDPEGYEDTPVHMREHPDFKPEKLRLGSFILRPVLETISIYDSNVFLDPDQEIADLAISFEPSLTVRSDFSRHALNLDVNLDATRYRDETGQNTFDAQVIAQGQFDVMRNLKAFLTIDLDKGHESRNDSTIPSSPLEPTETLRQQTELAVNYNPNRFNLTLFGGYRVDQFENGITRNTQTELIEEDRNKSVVATGIRAAYEMHPNYTPYVVARYSDERYHRRVYQNVTGGFTGQNQDKEIYSFAPGLSFNLKSIFTGHVEVGIAYEDAEDPNIDDKNTYVVDTEVIWNPTKLTTAIGKLNRNFDTDSNTNFGTVQTTLDLELHHELKRNFIVGAGLSGKVRNFDNSARLDRIFGGSMMATYMLNRNVSINAEYLYQKRLSETTSFDYDQHAVMIGLKSKF